MRTAGALESDFSGALLYRLGCGERFPAFAGEAAPLLRTNTLRIRTGAGYADLLHYRSGGYEAAADGGAGAFSVYVPDVRQHAVYFADFRTAARATAFRDNGAKAGYSPAGAGARYAAGLFAERLPAGGGSGTFWGSYARSEADDDVTVRSFPHDDVQPELNWFLYDLLEQTFGRRIGAAWSGDTKSVGGEWRRNGLFADLAGAWRGGTVECRYDNTEPSYLSGEKMTDINVIGVSFACRGGKRFRMGPVTAVFEPFYAYRRDSISIIPRNPTPMPDSVGGYYDLTDLGGGALTQKSGGVRMRTEHACGRAVWSFGTGFGIARYDGNGRVRTPVLGFAPVAVTHEFLGNARGTVRSQEYSAGWSYGGNGRMGADAGIRYLYAAIDADVTGQAGAVFNIVTTPVDETFRCRADVFTLHAGTDFAFTSRFTAGLRLFQVVPLFSVREGGESGVSAPSAGTGKKVEKFIRGGTEISIMGTWNFDR